MLSSLLYALCLIFVVCGVFYLVSLLFCFLLCGKQSDGTYFLILHNGTNDELYDKVYTAFLQGGYLSPFTKRPIIVLDNGISENAKSTCKFIVEPWGEVHFLNLQEIEKLIDFNFTNLNEIKH